MENNSIQLFAAIDDIVLDSCDTQQETPVCSYGGLVDQDCIEIVPSAFNNWFFKKTSQLGNSLDPAYKFKNDLVLFFNEPVSAQISSFSHFYVPNLKSDVSYCLNFWYLINGNIQLSLWTDKVDSNFDQHLRKTPIVTLNSHSGSSWAQAKIPLDDIFEDSKLIFGAGYAVNSQGTIAIDGLELNEGTCSFDYFCDFEDSCSWNNLGKDKSLTLTGSGITYKSTTEWIKVNAKNSGPDRDATLGSRDGHFLTLKSVNENAILTLPPFYLSKNSAEMCFSVKTYTSGQSTIEIISEQGGVLKLIEQKSMNSMNWELFQSVIKLDPNSSKVGHVHIVGSGRLAIDDVSISQGSCPIAGPIFTCKNGKQLSTLQVCDFISDCPGEGEDEHNCGGCYFSYDLCGYTHDSNAEWFGENGKARAKSSDFGKTHTKLTSPTLRPTAPTCKLQFGYEHKANDLTVLLVFQDGRAVEVWTNKMLTDWDKGTVEIKLGRIPVPFAVQFYSVLKNYFFVKDATSFGPVQFIDCGYQDTIDSFESSEIYNCKNGRRISQDQVCDQSIDCFDGDDEFNCDKYKIYSFEDSSDAECWTNLSNNNIKWSFVKASGQISSTPPRDHSTGLENSGYMAIYPLHDQQSDFSSAKEVSLVGPRLTSVDNCFMVFYYNTAGVDLIVSVFDNNSRLQKLLEIPGDLVFGFKRASVKLNKGIVSGVFRFVFTAKYSASIKLDYSQFGNPWTRISDNYYAAVDDIVISGSCFH
uniref:MAM domain-containing protein n=1 Tax=Tetranychus urticae TaxID=32264 RepID=T1KQ47_TETUR